MILFLCTKYSLRTCMYATAGGIRLPKIARAQYVCTTVKTYQRTHVHVIDFSLFHHEAKSHKQATIRPMNMAPTSQEKKTKRTAVNKKYKAKVKKARKRRKKECRENSSFPRASEERRRERRRRHRQKRRTRFLTTLPFRVLIRVC